MQYLFSCQTSLKEGVKHIFYLHGKFIEQSDKIAHQDYNYWRKNSPDVKVIKELRLDTGLGHGFLYKPIKQWLVPTKDWI